MRIGATRLNTLKAMLLNCAACVHVYAIIRLTLIKDCVCMLMEGQGLEHK